MLALYSLAKKYTLILQVIEYNEESHPSTLKPNTWTSLPLSSPALLYDHPLKLLTIQTHPHKISLLSLSQITENGIAELPEKEENYLSTGFIVEKMFAYKGYLVVVG